jgi:outer membrane protein assembly factor BamC
MNDMLGGESVDYKSQSQQTKGLEVPPDLTQLAKEGRYQPPAAVVSAAAAGTTPTRTASSGTQVAPLDLAGMKVMRDDGDRWLFVPLPADKLWPQLRAFWLESGFTLAVDDPKVGVLETDWAENRAKLPRDALRNTLGRFIEGLYDSGERDRFRTRVERIEGGTAVYVTHRGLIEVAVNPTLSDELRWQARPADKQLEAEFLSRLMVRLGSDEATARTELAAQATAAPARARLVAGEPTATLEVDEGFDRAWRRVGLALDRTGFTVEDRVRTEGVYFVRYVPQGGPVDDGRGFFARLFSSKEEAAKAQRVKLSLKTTGDKTRVVVQTAEGQPASEPLGSRIAGVLVDALK